MIATVFKIIARLSRADIVFYTMPLIMLVLIAGTVAPIDAIFYLFMYFIGGIFTFCLVIKFIFHSKWEWRMAGVILSHLGAIILLGGGFISSLSTQEWSIAVPEGQSASIEDKFSIALTDFTREVYAGTDKARSYQSDVIITDGARAFPTRIEMNKPLRYKGYTFYQSSFEDGAEGEVSVFSVVKNSGRLFPYLGTIVLTLGLLWHLVVVRRRG